MATVLLLLTYLAIILLIGLLTSIISQKFKIPNILLLLFIGIGLGRIVYKGGPLIEFPQIFMTGISILALVMIVFDSASRFKLKRVDYFSLHTLWLSLVFLIFNLIFLTGFTIIIFDVDSIFLPLIFAALMSGTDPAVVLSMFRNVKNKVFEFLGLESLLNTPLIVLLPFIILDMKTAFKDEIILSTFIEQFVPLLQQFVVGIGSGVLIGLIMFKFMRRQYSVVLSPLAVITSALLAYIIAENLDGNGVLAVTTMGILFGNIYVKQKFQLQEFALIFSNSLEILVFVLIGIVIVIPSSLEFLLRSLLLFVLYLMIRFISIIFSLRGIRLSKDDCVIGMVVATEEKTLLTVTENGYGKRTKIPEYRLISRGGSGVRNIICSERNGKVVSINSVSEDNQIMLISKNGITIRMSVSQISVIGRATQGVRLIKLEVNDKLVSVAKIVKE